ncbi:S8 family serine peptidase [Porphyrobacter sp. LM 6]|uniref:S8 family serine peptidase n=1 Tax=Porphyrobacter sp. LM 6 TaxID=1896196 RepID=UPI000847C836|nr:S8 family serine peptidase [Porphyrobacter sp. LM 6]AOL93028.1 Subtilase family protein [Porphyrobacter sp. LM 6]
MTRQFIAIVASLPLLALAAPASAQRPGDKIPGSYICVFDGTITAGQVPAAAQKAAEAGGGRVTHVYTKALRGFAVNASAQGLANMRAKSRSIRYCEQDQVVMTSQKKGGGTTTPQPAETRPWGIDRVNGGRAGTFATAWIIDTGIQLNHPDLRVDTQRSVSFVSDRSPNDANGHGTHVAGTVAAIDNEIGVIGVAPGALVVAIRVLDRSGSGSNSGVIAGVDHVAQNGRAGDVANMSLGGGASSALDTAVINAAATGVRFVIAAGNSAANAGNYSPARANGANIYTVSSFDSNGNLSSFSNFGNPPIDFSEPGSNINSTWIGSGYRAISGTSMAAPHLAGILLQVGANGVVGNGGQINFDKDPIRDTIGVVPAP